jgi:dephospho-CoA kinase
MLVIGLTGGIGSGKSTVGELFAKLDVPIIDADQASRAVVQPGQPALQTIVARFGSGMLNPDGSLNRGRLRELVFNDDTARKELETLLHPLIRAWMREQLQDLDAPYAILSIPLLVESGRTDTVDRVLVVDIPEQQQIERVCGRDDISEPQARAILATQADRQQRLAAADDVIDNSGNPEALEAQVQALHLMYLAISDHS